MMQALKIAATGMGAQQQNVNVIANNIANQSTVGFKRSRAAFNDLMYQNEIAVGALTNGAGTQAPTGAQIGLGVDLAGVYRIHSQGALLRTDNTYDLSIEGSGFFEVTDADGNTVYTRDGTFQIDQNGALVTSEGFAVQPAVTIDSTATEITIASDGTVSGKVNGATTTFGNLTIVNFTNPAGLEAIGDNFYEATDVSGTPTTNTPGLNGAGTLLQGFIEGSNVDPVESVTELITAQRAYELNSRIIAAADEMLAAANQIR